MVRSEILKNLNYEKNINYCNNVYNQCFMLKTTMEVS